MKRILVVGAGGDVGQGIVQAALAETWQVIAAGRKLERLQRLETRFASSNLRIIAGDLSDEQGATELWRESAAVFGGLDAVVVAVNAANHPGFLLDWTSNELNHIHASNVLTHFNAVKVFSRRLPQDGVFIGVGGGTADFVIPRMGQLSMAQAALRMMYRTVAKEQRARSPKVQELMIVSMVNGESNRAQADPSWLTELEVGRHVCAMIKTPDDFPSSIVSLRSRNQIGAAEAKGA